MSWSEEHKSASTGDYTVKLYDAAGYSGMKKAQRAGESVEQVAPLASFTVNHQVRVRADHDMTVSWPLYEPPFSLSLSQSLCVGVILSHDLPHDPTSTAVPPTNERSV